MNFTEKVKNEIAENGLDMQCCAYALLSAYLKLCGSIVKTMEGTGIEFSTDNESTANFVTELLNNNFLADITELDVGDDRLNKKDRYTGSIYGEAATEVLLKTGLITADGTILSGIDCNITKNECCKKAYIKGAFLGGGNITLPSGDGGKTGYHLEVVFPSYDIAEDFSALLCDFEILAKIAERKTGYAVYVKSSEEIKDFLALMGLMSSVLELTDIMCRKELSSHVNRQRNCDLGNLNKQVNATERQLSAFRIIEETIGYDKLDKPLCDVIFMRLENEEDTLSELAEKLGVTKSCLNHRLRKIMAIAEELK